MRLRRALDSGYRAMRLCVAYAALGGLAACGTTGSDDRPSPPSDAAAPDGTLNEGDGRADAPGDGAPSDAQSGDGPIGDAQCPAGQMYCPGCPGHSGTCGIGGCPGYACSEVDAGGDQDAGGGQDEGGDADASVACGSSTCAADEYCVRSCCGGTAPPCVDEDDAGMCPNGFHSDPACPFVHQCRATCTPPAPYCTDAGSMPSCTVAPNRTLWCGCA